MKRVVSSLLVVYLLYFSLLIGQADLTKLLPQSPADSNQLVLLATKTGRSETQLFEAVSILKFITLVHPDKAMQKAARDKLVNIEPLLLGPSIMALAPERQAHVRKIARRLTRLTARFEINISNHVPAITVTNSELAGLDRGFIESLARTKKGLYVLRVDKPTYQAVGRFCTVSSTREKIWLAYHNRAYPVNERLLDQILSLYKEYAHSFGFTNCADYFISAQMAGGIATVESFLGKILSLSQEKYTQELRRLYNGDVKPWDLGHLVYRHPSRTDSRDRVSEFFPVEQTINRIFSVYERFFGIRFKREFATGLWHKQVEHVGVYDSSGRLLGHLLLDLYPREHKFSRSGTRQLRIRPVIVAIVANFPRLLSISDVRTCFHELGHALHTFFGGGGLEQTDFRESIAKLFEAWAYEPSVIRAVSGHYKTGEQLKGDLVAKLCRVDTIGMGMSIQRKIGKSQLCIDCFAESQPKVADQLVKNMYEKYLAGISYDPRAHPLCSFGHLVKQRYGPLYYSYLWADVLSSDLFAELKRRGLDNPDTGKLLIEKILSKGSGSDPNQIVRDFLGREPNLDAFKARMGLVLNNS